MLEVKRPNSPLWIKLQNLKTSPPYGGEVNNGTVKAEKDNDKHDIHLETIVLDSKSVY